jgi:hypothetical protein
MSLGTTQEAETRDVDVVDAAGDEDCGRGDERRISSLRRPGPVAGREVDSGLSTSVLIWEQRASPRLTAAKHGGLA